MQMEPERLNRIKIAWMNRYGTTESQWDNFEQQNPFTTHQGEIQKRKAGTDHEFDSLDEEASKMEFIFCPDEREMGMRYRSKANHFRRLADKLSDDPVQARQYRNEAKFWDRLSEQCFYQSNDNRRKL